MAGYGDDAGFTTWTAANGYTLPPGAPSAAVLRQRGSTYVDGTYGARFSGTPTGGFAQERAWPRTGACAYGTPIGDSVIPAAVVDASYHAAFQEANEPGSLTVVGSAASRVKRERVEGAVEVEYQTAAAGSDWADEITPVMSVIEGLLAPFLRLAAVGIGIAVV